MRAIIEFPIAASGTTGVAKVPEGWRLVGLELPTLDSTTIVATLSSDGGTTYRTTFDGAGTTNATIGGTANTGNRFVNVVDSLSRLTDGMKVKLTVASQTSAAVIKGICIPHEG